MNLKDLINEAHEARRKAYNNQDWDAYKIANERLSELLIYLNREIL